MKKQRYWGDHAIAGGLVLVICWMGFESYKHSLTQHAILQSFVTMTQTPERQSKTLDSGVRLESKNTDSEFLVAIQSGPDFSGCEYMVHNLLSQRNLDFSYIDGNWINEMTSESVSRICENSEKIVFQGDLKKNQSQTPKLDYSAS